MALFRRNSQPAPTQTQLTAAPTPPTLGKSGPTPTRREAETARRQRVHKTLTKKEARIEASRHNRTERMRATMLRESTPEKALMRNHVDGRFNLGEFLLPSLVVILALSFLSTALPRITVISTVVMYLFIVSVLLDGSLMWRGFKKVLAARLPNAPTRGLLMYGMNRMIQIRRFRTPRPRIKRGEKY